MPPTPAKKGVKGEDEEGEGSVAVAASPSGDAEGEGKGVGKLAALGPAEVEVEEVIELGAEMEPVKDEVETGEEDEEGGSGGSTFVFPETSNNLTPTVLKTRLSGKKLKCVFCSIFRPPPFDFPALYPVKHR